MRVFRVKCEGILGKCLYHSAIWHSNLISWDMASMIKYLSTFFIPLVCFCGCIASNDGENSTGQEKYIGPHHEHHKKFLGHSVATEAGWDSLHSMKTVPEHKPVLQKKPDLKVFGWHMYSHGTQYRHYNYSMLWGISYFAYIIEPSNGQYKNIYYWKTTGLVDSAKAHNCLVFLTAGLYGQSDNTAFLENIPAQNTLADNLVGLLKLRDADGINIDFESVPGRLSVKFSQFIARLSRRLKEANPDYKLSLALYAIDKENLFDIPSLNPHIDFYTLMAYDYYGSFSEIAGPVAPLKSSASFGTGSMETSIQHYLHAGVAPGNLIVGLPLYGAHWRTAEETAPSKALQFISHFPYDHFQHEYIDSLQVVMQNDNASGNSFYSVMRPSGQYEQFWMDNIQVLSEKLDYIINNKLAGVGFWTLGYSTGDSAFWTLLHKKVILQEIQ